MIKSILSLGCASMLLAGSALGYTSTEDRLDTLEKEMHQVSAKNPQNTLGAAFTTARPDTVGNNWFATLGVIYWHPKMGGTEFAYTNTSDVLIANAISGPLPGETTVTIQRPNPPAGDVKTNDFSWDVGLKAGLGYKTPHDSWDVYAHYTWFNSNDGKSVSKDVPSLIISLKGIAALIAGHAKSNVGIDYNNIDLELARSFFLSGRFSLRAHFDVKSTWLDLSQDVTYNYGTLINTPFNGLDFKVKDDCKIWGFGPRTGVDGKLYLGHGFSLNGELSGSILYGRFNAHHKENWPLLQLASGSPPAGGNQLNIKDKFHQFIPFVQTFIGLSWETFLNQNKQYFSLKAGYEVQYYWRVNQMSNVDQALQYTIGGPTPSGIGVTTTGLRTNLQKYSEDLMFYGITGEVRLDF